MSGLNSNIRYDGIDARVFCIALASLKGMTIEFARMIESRFDSLRDFFKADASTISALMSMRNRLFDRIVRDEAIRSAIEEYQWATDNGVNVLYYTDEEYPARLIDCPDAPLVIYTLGKVNFNARHVISIVGTRHATLYGQNFIKKLIADIAKRLPDVLIISGLAYGIDIAAHREAIANGIPTVAVLAHGLSTIYPAVHRGDAKEMVNGKGGLLTDYGHSAAVHRGNFLARNRIVAGMCDALIIVESASKGGALLTARIASDYNRDVFAVPGRIGDIYSEGCNNLIRDNRAAMITSAGDLYDAMRWSPLPDDGDQQELFRELTEDEKLVIDYLTIHGEAYINRMAVELGKQMSQMIQLLGDMEFSGLIIMHPGGRYTLA